MKLKTQIITALAVAGAAQMASADVTIDITGATAFRQAAVEAIRASYTSVPLYGFQGTSFGGANFHIFKGAFPGISGTTTIRTSWNGSTEGARACVFDLNNDYLPAAIVGLATTGTPSLSTAVLEASNAHDLYFSDVNFSKTVYSTFALQPAEQTEVSGLTQTTVGAVVFALIKNEASANFASLTNISKDQYKSLLGTANAGRMRLSQLTGLDADLNKIVYATGRNDLSGTRTSYMLEMGFGPSNPCAQWKMISTTTNVCTTIQLWPTGDNLVAGNDNRSVQWTLADTTLPAPYPSSGGEIAGNGGFFSGSVLRGLMDDTSASVDVKDNEGNLISSGQDVALVTYLSQSDAATAIGGGAVALTYNGVGITPATPLSAGDKAKVRNGAYTAWSYEQFCKTGAASTDETAVYNGILNVIQSTIGNTGLSNADMAGADRPDDGGVITIAVP